MISEKHSLEFILFLMVEILHKIFLIFIVLSLFNILIFFHELGHFLAARWRGLKVDRFQIWFGKPIFEIKKDGVSYSLGWIPAGGFVSLPQIAALEHSEDEENLDEASALDKIIVAAAGPLFSFLLAVFFACLVFFFGKPETIIPSTQIGFVQKNSPAQKSGLQKGDFIVSVNGEKVNSFSGSLESLQGKIILSEKEKITFGVKRKGESKIREIISEFEIPQNSWFERKGFRQVGISPVIEFQISKIFPFSPAEKANLKVGDKILEANGVFLYHLANLQAILNSLPENASIRLLIQREGKERRISLKPEKPLIPENHPALLGVVFKTHIPTQTTLVYPPPTEQIQKSLETMWLTLSKVISPKSSINFSHLSGPVGIAKHQMRLLQNSYALQWSLWFLVVLNINLAVLNLIPFPVLDGGHIVISFVEGISRKKFARNFLINLQSLFALLLFGFLIYITIKDVGEIFSKNSKSATKEIKFSPGKH